MNLMLCPRAGKLFGRCRFEPRYDIEPSRALTEEELAELWPNDVPAAIENARGRRYVRDLCVTCGRTIERNDESRDEGAQP